MPHILLVEDEIDLARLVQYNLQKEADFNVSSVHTGQDALSFLAKQEPDLVLLDLMLPDMSGFDICGRIKNNPRIQHLPVIMLTARSAESDRVKGFEVGADDYVVKPFSPKELVLRVKALLARTLKQNEDQRKNRFILNGLVIDTALHRVYDQTGQEIVLSKLEFQILEAFLRHPANILSREQLIKLIWQTDGDEIIDRTIDTHIKRIRHKLGKHRSLIQTVRGIGYRLDIPVDKIDTPELAYASP